MPVYVVAKGSGGNVPNLFLTKTRKAYLNHQTDLFFYTQKEFMAQGAIL